MRKLIAFNSVTADGYFAGAAGDISWAYQGSDDAEYRSFVSANASGGGELVFGRVTYQMMASYWPTPLALQQNPTVAEGMNRMKKIVFSRTLRAASWSNTTLINSDLTGAIHRLKQEHGPGMTILGSGSIIAQLAAERLIDEYQLVVNPVVLGSGRTMFEGIPAPQNLKLTRSRIFPNGKVYLCYEQA